MNVDNRNVLATPRPSEVSREPTGAQRGMGREAFMKLLVAQLRNQDPMDPMDPRDSIAQLAQLSGVEQLVAIEGRLRALEVAGAGMVNAQAVALVGRTVEAEGGTLRLGEQGGAEASFTLRGRAERVEVRVLDAEGRMVRKMQLEGGFPGTRSVSWDGLDEQGERLPPGRYRIEVEAYDAEGRPVEVDTTLRGRVERLAYDNGYPELVVEGRRVVLGDVRFVEP